MGVHWLMIETNCTLLFFSRMKRKDLREFLRSTIIHWKNILVLVLKRRMFKQYMRYALWLLVKSACDPVVSVV